MSLNRKHTDFANKTQAREKARRQRQIAKGMICVGHVRRNRRDRRLLAA